MPLDLSGLKPLDTGGLKPLDTGGLKPLDTSGLRPVSEPVEMTSAGRFSPPGETVGRGRHATSSLAIGAGMVASGLPKSIAMMGMPAPEIMRNLERIDQGQPIVPTIPMPVGRGVQMAGASQADLLYKQYQAANPEERQQIRQQFEQQATEAGETAMYRAGNAVDQWFRDNFPTNPKYQDEFWTSKVPAGIGSGLSFVASSMLSRGLLGPVGRSAIGTYGSPAVLGSAVNQVDQFEQALEAGADIETALEAADFGSLIGYSEAIPIGNLLNRLDKASGGQVKRYLLRALQQGTEEAVQESFAGVMNAAVSQKLYDPERGIWTFERAEEGAVGFITGAVLETLMTLAVPGRRRGQGPSGSRPLVEPTLEPEVAAEPEAQTAEEVRGYADARIRAVDALGENASTVERAERDWLRQHRDQPELIAEAYGVTLKQDMGNPNLPKPSKGDIDSPIETETIQKGRKLVEDALAGRPSTTEVTDAPQTRTTEAQEQTSPLAPVRQGTDAQEATPQGRPAEPELLTTEPAIEVTGTPGAELSHGFRRGPEEGIRYRVSDRTAMGAVLLEKRNDRLGSQSGFYVGADGNLVDADTVVLNRVGEVDRLWTPENDTDRAAAAEILNEMGALPLSDPRRAALKEQLKGVVLGRPRESTDAQEATPQRRPAEPELLTPTEPAPDADVRGPVAIERDGITVRGPSERIQQQYQANALPYSAVAETRHGPIDVYGRTAEDALQKALARSDREITDAGIRDDVLRGAETGVPAGTGEQGPGATAGGLAERRPGDAVPAGPATEGAAAVPDLSEAADASPALAPRAPITRKDLPDGKDTAVTPTGREVPVRYTVVEAADLVASQTDDGRRNADYPAELQPRDRGRAVSAQQIQDIARNLNPRLLDRSPRASDGAPIIAEDGVVESGNGRVLAIRRAYREGRGDAYRDYLAEQGYPVEGLSQPVLVRVREGQLDPAARQAFTREANERDNLGMSATERAMADAAALPEAMLEMYRGGDVDTAANRDFVRAFVERVVARNEQASLIAGDGTLSQEAVRRIEGALLAKAYGDAALVATLIESADSNIRAIGGALMDVAPGWAQMRAESAAGRIDPAMDQTPRLLEAVRLVQRARREGRSIAEFVGQQDMLSGESLNTVAEAFLRLMFRNTQSWTQPAGRDKMAGALTFYLDQAKRALPGTDLLGDAAPDPAQILDTARQRQYGQEQQQPDLLAQPAGRPGERDRTDGPERDRPAESAAPAREPETPATGEPGTTAEEVSAPLRIEDYTDKSIIVRGETRQHKDRIKAALPNRRAMWNRKAVGWTFPKAREAEVRKALADLLGESPSAPATVRGTTIRINMRDRQVTEESFEEPVRPVTPQVPAIEGMTPLGARPSSQPGERLIGKNNKGQPIYEDEQGVRSYVERGIRITEPVGVIPGGGISINTDRRGAEYKPVEETPQVPASAADLERAEKAWNEISRSGKQDLIEHAGLTARMQDLSGTEWQRMRDADKSTLALALPTFEIGGVRLYGADTPQVPAVVGAGMQVEFGGKRYPVESIEDARDKWIEFRMETAEGMSGIGNGVPVFQDGQQVARISYNGRAWDMDGKPIGEGGVDWMESQTGPRKLDPSLTPIDLSLSPMEKARALHALGRENKAAVDRALARISDELGFESRSNFKALDAIVAKAGRPSFQAKYPNAGVEYVHDSFRFKSIVPASRVADIQRAIDIMVEETGAEILKLDFPKMAGDNEWGWRVLPVDLRMPNGLIVEYYFPLLEIDVAQQEKGHALFETWRNEDFSTLKGGRRLKYERDARESRALYDAAFSASAESAGLSEAELMASFTSLEASLASRTRDQSSRKSSPVIGPQSLAGIQEPSTRTIESPPAGQRTSTTSVPDNLNTLLPTGDSVAQVTGDSQDVSIGTEVDDDGIQEPVPVRDARAGAEDVQPAAPDRGDGPAPAGEIDRGAPDVRGTDRDSAETPERPDQGTVAAGGQGASVRGADRVPERGAAAERPAESVKGANYRIEPGALAEDRGRTQKARDNIRAIELMREIEAQGRPATQAEQQELARYVGWGGLKGAFPNADGNFEKGFETVGRRLQELLSETEYATARRSLQYAHYTAENVVNSMWQGVRQLGFTGGKVFEPGMGVGNFAGLMPADIAAVTDYNGLELDHTTARIARLLYPQWGVRQDDYTRAPLPKDTFDLVIGNPPFADVAIKSDPGYPQGFLLHDYFFAKSLDGVRPGGLLAFISSAGTMNKIDSNAREYFADRADLVGAIRLPGTAFQQSAGTSVTTDILFFRKRLPGEPGRDLRKSEFAWTGTVEVTLPNKHGKPTKGRVSRYFVDNPEMVLGEEGFFDPLYENRYGVRAAKDFDLQAALNEAIGRLPENVMSEWADTTARAEVDFGTAERKEGSYYVGRDGKLMQQREGVGRPVERRGKGVEGGKTLAELERIKGLVPIRDALRAVYQADLAEDTGNAATARKRLNEAYDAFVKRFGPINKAEFQYRRPTVIQQESARAEAREEARYAGAEWNEGTFDATRMIAEGATTTAIAKARREARERAGQDFDEGSFNPADMPDITIEKRPNIDPFIDDPENYRLRSIEEYDDQSGESKKRAVFRENVITRERTPEINSVNDALLYVLNKHGRLDIPALAQAAKVSESEAIEQLGDGIFRLPETDNQWVVRDEYLSGNVRRKLRQAKAAAARDPSLQRNVDALEAAQPVPLPASEISANLGMPWLPPAVIEQFGTESLGLSSLKVSYTPALAQWTVSGDTDSAAAKSTWGTDDRNASALIADALNRQNPRIYNEYRDGAGNKVRELDSVATEAAQEKMQAIKQQFSEWVWSDPARAEQLAQTYNDEYNSLIAREFDGTYLTTPGISSEWRWRPHQTRVIARIIQDGNTYMAHAVGSGKTSAMIGSGMEMRRLGLVRKPMYTVPNHMLGQFTKEFYEQYPTARIMVADERRFHTHRRKQFIADVAQQDLDAIVITHSAFGMIPISDTFQDGLIQEQIAQYRELLTSPELEGKDNRITRSRLENQIERLEQRLSGRGTKRRDQVFTFEEMGVDFLFVDEAHLFRKLDFATKMSNVKGISPEGSKASWDLFVKTRYLETVNPGRNLVLASGTPVTNTMAELYTVSRYLQLDELRERGLEHFDAWAGAFGDTVTNLEQNAAGGYQPVTRFAKFVNVPELSVMVRQNMDVVTSRQLEQYVTRPTIKDGGRKMNLAEKDEALEAYQSTLASRMEAIKERKGPPKPGDDIMLSVINDGRHAAIDMRLVDPNLPPNPGSKLNLMIDNVFRIWKETKRQPFHKPQQGGYSDKPIDKGPAAQMIFANLGLSGVRGFAVPDYIRAELARRGVPKNQIAYISDFKSHVARQRLFNDMNEGKVRILIGSTAKMATGVNAQRRLYAVHNLDPLWYPADDEQRNGRILRQGNMNPEIEIHDYSTKGTYDSTMWGMMETKARFIQGFFEGDPNLRDMEDLGEASQYEQAKALTTADPRLIELTELRQNLEKAVRRKSAFHREQYANQQRVAQARDHIRHYERRIPQIEADIARRQDTSGDKFKAELDGKTYTDRVDFGDVLLGRLDLLKAEKNKKYHAHKIGRIGGFDLVVGTWHAGSTDGAELGIMREGGYQSNSRVSESALGTVQSVEHVLRSFEGDRADAENRLQRAQRQLQEFQPQLGKTFTGQAEIDDLSDRVDALEAELASDRQAVPDGAQVEPEYDPDVSAFIDEGGAVQPGDERYSLAKRLTEKQFRARYYQHVDIRGRQGAAAENLSAIREGGFRSGYRNTLPITDGGTTVIDRAYAPRPGDTVYLVPRNQVDRRGKVRDGWVPKPSEVLQMQEGESVYEAYLRTLEQPLFSMAPTPWYFSALARAAEKVPQDKGTGMQMLGSLKNMAGVKPEELQWTGLEEYLRAVQGPVTRQQIVQYLKGNGVQVETVTLSDQSGEHGARMAEIRDQLSAYGFVIDFHPMNQEWAFLPHENDNEPLYDYDELRNYLIEQDMPAVSAEARADALIELGSEFQRLHELDGIGGETEFRRYTLPGGTNYREVLLKLPPAGPIQSYTGRIIPNLADGFDADSILTEISAEGLESLSYGRVDVGGSEVIEFEGLSQQHFNEFTRIAQENGATIDAQSAFEDTPPPRVELMSRAELSAWYQQEVGYDPVQDDPGISTAALREMVRGYAAENGASRAAPVNDTFVSPHFPAHQNVLAHFRLNDRTGPNGERILFVEEVQAESHQQGRKHGYTGVPPTDAQVREFFDLKEGADPADYRQEMMDSPEYQRKLVPDAPFKNNAWVELAIKRVLRLAAEGGYDSVSWTTGEQQADRYDLSKQVDALNVVGWPSAGEGKVVLAAWKDDAQVIQKTINESELESYIGKEAAEKISKMTPDPVTGLRRLAGDELKIGGHGMIGFYDRTLPNLFKKVARKLDKSAEVGRRVVDKSMDPEYQGPYTITEAVDGRFLVYDRHTEYSGPFASRSKAQAYIDRIERDADAHAGIHAIAITDKMREGAMAGQSLFAVQGKFTERAAAVEADLKARLEQVGISDRVAVKLVDGIRRMDGERMAGAEGRYLARLIEVAAIAPSPMWVMNHEIIHALRDLGVIRSAEWRTLERKAQGRMEEIRRRYRKQNLTEEQLVEEAVADMHADWSTGQEQAQGFLRTAYERIKNFMEALGNALRGNGFRSADDVFRKIGTGEVGRRRGFPGEEPREAEAFASKEQTDSPEFKRWFGNSNNLDEQGQPRIWYRGQIGATAANEPFSATAGGAPSFADSPQVASTYAENPEAAGLYGFRQRPEGYDQGGNVAPYYVRGQVFDLSQFQGAHGTETGMTPQQLRAALKALGIDQRDVVFTWAGRYGRGSNAFWDSAEDDVRTRIMAGYEFADNEVVQEVLREKGYSALKLKGALQPPTRPEGQPWGEEVVHDELRVVDPDALMSSISPRFDDGRYSLRPEDFNPNRVTGATTARRAVQQRAGDPSGRLPPITPDKDPMALFRDGFSTPEESLIDLVRFKLQDKYIDLRRVQEAVEGTGQRVDDQSNAYMLEELYHGKAEVEIEEARKASMEPLLEAIRKSDLSIEQAGEYLYARHAKERNARIQEINPRFAEEGGGSGMTDAEADAILARYAGPQVERIGALVDAIVAKQRSLLVSSGLETFETVDSWERLYQFYVPLKGHAEIDTGRAPTGSGFDVRGKTKRALGRKSLANNIIANLLAQYEATIVRSQKAEVGRALLRFVEANPNQSLWEIDKIQHQASIDRTTGLVVYRPSPRYQLAENVLVVKVEGKDHHITFHGPRGARIAASMKNMGAAKAGTLVRALAATNRVLAMVNTSLNPEFIVSNLVRDLQTAGINLAGTEADGAKARIIRDVGRAWHGIRRAQKGKEGEWAAHYEAFRKAGGKTGWIDAHNDVDRLHRQLGKEIQKHSRSGADPRRLITALAEFVEHENTAVENAVRLSAFVHARRLGVSEAKAASMAKNLTVNFNRKGEYGVIANALYLFYNAAFQGMVRTLQAIRHSAKVRMIVGGIVVFATMLDILNRMLGGEDDDEIPLYDKIPPWVKERNLIIMNPWGEESYFKLPLPWGYNVFHVLGQNVGSGISAAMGQNPDFNAADSALNVISAIIGSYNPLGSDATLSQFLSPTATDPIVSLEANLDWAGRQIRPGDNPFEKAPTPDSQQFWGSTSEISKAIAQQLNSLTGGTTVRPGLIDVSPTTLDYLYEFATGGVGRFVSNVVDAPLKLMVDDDIETYRIPFMRQVYGDVGTRATQDQFYKNIEQVYYAETEYKLAVEAKDVRAQADIRRRHGPYLLARLPAREAERKLRVLRQHRDQIRASKLPERAKRDKLKLVEEQMEQEMLKFNYRLRKAQQ